jgi:hypothetical protein
MTQAVEIAYLRSGFVRVVQTGPSLFEVQSLRLRRGMSAPSWKKLYGAFDRDKAIRLLVSYAFEDTATIFND